MFFEHNNEIHDAKKLRNKRNTFKEYVKQRINEELTKISCEQIKPKKKKNTTNETTFKYFHETTKQIITINITNIEQHPQNNK